MDEQCLKGVAHAGLLGLRIDGEFHGHFEIGLFVDEEVADAVVVLDDRHAGEGNDCLDQAFSAARDDEVEPLIHAGHGGDAAAVGEGDELDGMLGQAGFRAAFLEGGGDGEVRVDGLAAAAQDGGVAGLEAERRGIGGHVGAAFENDADGADGNAHLLDADAVGAVPVIKHLADGIGQGGDVFERGGDGFEAFFIEAEAVEHRGGEAFFLTGGDVLGVGCEDFRGGIAEALCHRDEDGVFRVRRELGKLVGGGACMASHLVDLFGDGIAHGLAGMNFVEMPFPATMSASRSGWRPLAMWVSIPATTANFTASSFEDMPPMENFPLSSRT